LLSRITEFVRAVDDVSFCIEEGETFGLVGESGCGKTTVARTILRLLDSTSGGIYFDGIDLNKLKLKELKKMRENMQIIFQDPYSSLNPRMMVKNIVGEPLIINKIAKGEKLRSKILELLVLIGLNEEHMNRFPHEFSGGQRQRIAIARALALNPKFLVLDEPTSALDVSVQAHILNMLKELQKTLGLTYLYISHDLNIVRNMSDRIAVMYVGKIVEIAETEELFRNALHPYTQALFSAIPVPDPEFTREKIILTGEIPSPRNPPSGCRFHPRCYFLMQECKEKEPEITEVGKEHFVACHRASTAPSLKYLSDDKLIN